LRAGLASFADDRSPLAERVREELTAQLTPDRSNASETRGDRPSYTQIHEGALRAARQAVLAMRADEEIGDEAFHRLEEELDWLEMANAFTAQARSAESTS